MPTSNDDAIFPVAGNPGTVDLGGVNRSAITVRFNAAGYALSNGTLSTRRITATAPVTIDAALRRLQAR